MNSSSPTPPGVASFGTVCSAGATRALLLGSGELGKEVAIELARLGIETVAVDRYAEAPAMHVANEARVIDMLNPNALREVIDETCPQLIIPEIEAIATSVLDDVAKQGTRQGPVRVVPTARAARLTMDREGIRRLVAEELSISTSPYRFADTADEVAAAVEAIGLPCVIKPVMSSSGKGQSTLSADATNADVLAAWEYAQTSGRSAGHGTSRVIVEGFVDFDYEITLLTVRSCDGVFCCAPIGHVQIDGDYRQSWQPYPMTEAVLTRAESIARQVTAALCQPDHEQGLPGYGIFGVELFVCGDEVLFSEVSPRPHDTGMVTLASQEVSEFGLHVRAVLGLPIGPLSVGGRIPCLPAASVAILAEGDGVPEFRNVPTALAVPMGQLRIFGKPRVGEPGAPGRRRVGVALARGNDAMQARERADQVAERVDVVLT